MRKLYIKEEWADLGLSKISDLKKIILAYKNMRDRCYNKNHQAFKHYGGRGITVCEEWLNDRDSFISWSIKHWHKENLSLDKIDNNKGYSPLNCRWASSSMQQSNKRCFRDVCIDGEFMTAYEACIKAGAVTEADRSRMRKRIWEYGVTTLDELKSNHLRTKRVNDRENKCLECGTSNSCKWRSNGTLCNTCYCRSLRRLKASQSKIQ